MEKTTYHHGDLRTALLDAAEEELQKDPNCLLSVRSLAGKIGVSATAPHAHFATKSDLLAALATRGFARLGEALGGVSQDTLTPQETLARLAEQYLEFGAKNIGLYRLMFTRGVSLETNVELRQASRASYEVLRNAIACALPGVSSDATDRHAFTAWALVHGFASLLNEGRIAEDTIADRSHAALADTAAALLVQAGSRI